MACSAPIMAARYLRFLARRASDRKRGRDGTAYSDYHAPGGFLSHHLARISMAAVYWDAQHIDEGVRFLKQHARPHALARRCHYALTRPAAAGCCTSTGPEAVSRIPPVARVRRYLHAAAGEEVFTFAYRYVCRLPAAAASAARPR